MQLHEIQRPVHASAIESLISADAPARHRALAVLDGVLSGRAWADDPVRPSAAIVIEDADGTVYAGGSVSRSDMERTLSGVETASGDLIFSFASPTDPFRDLVPMEPYWTGEAIDFTDRLPSADEDDAPIGLEDGHEVVELDASTLPLIEWFDDTVHAFGSVDRWTELGRGFGILAGGRLAAEAMAGPRCRGLMEMGVATRQEFRRRGYGTLVSRLTICACEAVGNRVWWNANAGNEPSLRIARRMGFRTERRYELAACHTFGAADPSVGEG